MENTNETGVRLWTRCLCLRMERSVRRAIEYVVDVENGLPSWNANHNDCSLLTPSGLRTRTASPYFVGTRRFSSSCQFSTTTICDCEGSLVVDSPGFMMRKRSPSGAMSHCLPTLDAER